MNSILHYGLRFLREGTEPALLLLPVYWFVRMLYLNGGRQPVLSRRKNPVREVLMAGFFVYLVMLFTQTFVTNPGANEVRLIPFESILTQWRLRNEAPAYRNLFIFNVLGNIGVFVPIGLMTACLFRGGFGKTVAAGFLLSLLIEGTQLPLDRTSDVDDLMLNTAGAAVGYFFFWMFSRLKCRQRCKSGCADKDA